MKAYIGAKVIQAEPLTRRGSMAGGFDEEGYKVVYPDGYVSWSPKATFEGTYRELSEGEAASVARAFGLGKGVDASVWEQSARKMSEP